MFSNILTTKILKKGINYFLRVSSVNINSKIGGYFDLNKNKIKPF